jgi:hypothetical protein
LMLIAPYDWEPCQGGKKNLAFFFFFVYLVNKFFCTIIKSDFIKENGGL